MSTSKSSGSGPWVVGMKLFSLLALASFGLSYTLSIGSAQSRSTSPVKSAASDVVAADSKFGLEEPGSSAVPGAVFTNPAAITIPTVVGNGNPYPSPITVSGLPTSIPTTPDAIKVTINGLSHTFPDDFGFVLVAPNGDALLIQDGAGDGTDVVNLTYTISDSGAAVIPTAGAWAPGTYKPTAYYTGDSFPAPGPLLAYGNPGPIAGGTATFVSTFGGDNPNGVWNLYVRDFVTANGGMIAGGWSLEIAGSVTPVAAQHVIDFDGDGKSDPTVVRNVGGGSGGQVGWFINTSSNGSTLWYNWGISTDFFVPADYDGDDKTDIAVWRSTSTEFYILQSQTNTLRRETFGQPGDDPTVVADYNGDGAADLAVYRAGAAAGNPSTWFYRTTAGGAVNYVPWGMNGDFPAPGDYDGNGSADFVVQRNDGGGVARFWRRFSTGTTDTVVFGNSTAVIVPGDYDGDSKTDIATVQGVSGQLEWRYLSSMDGSTTYITFGLSATDFPTQGDYDGDGKTDTAIWRPSATPGASAFWFRNSGGTVNSVPFGQNGDYPVANFNTH